MSRLPFDPSLAAGPPEDDPKQPARRERQTFGHVGEAEHLTVSELAGLIKATLEQRIASPLRVIGQVSNLNARNHWYFSLKDDAAVVSCVAWASAAKKFGFIPVDGDEVVATGHVSHYPPQGRTQFYVSSLKPVGAGALQLRFQALCEELRGLGYFDETTKQPLPAFPRRIAVITSAGGAAVHDVVSTAAQRCRAVALLIVDVRVQGDGAAEEVANAIRWVDARQERLAVDAVVVTRGGGSIEDLWAFNERCVADAAHACRLPLVAAIGHESDTTVIELVADRRAATPTQAAMMLVPSAAEMDRQVHHLHERIDFVTRRVVVDARQHLRLLTRHEAFRDPTAIIRRARERVGLGERHLLHGLRHRIAHDRGVFERLASRFAGLRPDALIARRHERLAVLADRLDRSIRERIDCRSDVARLERSLHSAAIRCVERLRSRAVALARELTAVDPRSVLGRGYSYTTTTDGRLIRSIQDVTTGDPLLTNVADGTIRSEVTGRSKPPSARRSSKRNPDGADQMDLFGMSE